MKLANDRLYRFLSIRQLLWNDFAARDDGAADFSDARQLIFDQLEPLLFSLIVGNGRSVVVSAKIKDSYDLIPALRSDEEICENRNWMQEDVVSSDIKGLTFEEFFSWDRYGFNNPELVRFRAIITGPDGEIETNLLIPSRLVDFFIE